MAAKVKDPARPSLPVRIVVTREEAERAVALEIAELVRTKPRTVLGLATGSTPIGVYRELVRLHREEALDFSRAITFNLDEYLGLVSGHPSSFGRWMRSNFFDAVNVPEVNIHTLDGSLELARARVECERYEQTIADAGGIDLMMLGIGRNGHIGFNEPGAARDTRTRCVELHPWTRADAAHGFGGLEQVPHVAITMGVTTILDSRRLCVMAFGEHKAQIVKRTLEGAIGPDVPSTYLREHSNVCLWLDRSAASG